MLIRGQNSTLTGLLARAIGLSFWFNCFLKYMIEMISEKNLNWCWWLAIFIASNQVINLLIVRIHLKGFWIKKSICILKTNLTKSVAPNNVLSGVVLAVEWLKWVRLLRRAQIECFSSNISINWSNEAVQGTSQNGMIFLKMPRIFNFITVYCFWNNTLSWYSISF